MIHPDRLKELTEGAEREAEQTHPLDSQVTMKDGSVIPSRSATQGARYSACRAALLKSALMAEGLVEALAFYAKEWDRHSETMDVQVPGSQQQFCEPTEALIDDGGEVARAALHAFNTNRS